MSEPTRVACVMGWPAKQSRSPKLHGYWIKRYNIDGDYRVAEIPPEDFPTFVTNLAKNGYVGGNVTMPHKDVALAMSEPDERARTFNLRKMLVVGEVVRFWKQLHHGRTDMPGLERQGNVSP